MCSMTEFCKLLQLLLCVVNAEQNDMPNHAKTHQQLHQEALRRAQEIFNRASAFHEEALRGHHSAFDHQKYHQDAMRRAQQYHEEIQNAAHNHQQQAMSG